MSVFLYEPFYDMERFIDEAFSGRQESTSDKGHRRIGRGEGDGAPRSLKPRYAPRPIFPSASDFLQYYTHQS